MISDFKRGTAFGELALLSNDNKRNATIICETDVVFATLIRSDFESV